ncbi:MAG: polymer-forming cytoskeletal protein [Myxococcales bacterium]|nr:polymer-forming cytoskeletal protein [Myxococcales bacterium]
MASKAVTVIAAGTVVAGRIEGAEDVDLFGRIEGSLKLKGALKIDEKARADAELDVTRLEVRGILVGNATASESIELFGTARVVGDLVAPRIIVRDGARFRGLIDMGEPAEADDEAPARRPEERVRARRLHRPALAAGARPRPAEADDANAEES